MSLYKTTFGLESVFVSSFFDNDSEYYSYSAVSFLFSRHIPSRYANTGELTHQSHRTAVYTLM